jgi:hypothetical protein
MYVGLLTGSTIGLVKIKGPTPTAKLPINRQEKKGLTSPISEVHRTTTTCPFASNLHNCDVALSKILQVESQVVTSPILNKKED